MPTIANPLGLLAQLGIPAVLVVHFLQRKANELLLSTLFLLKHAPRAAASLIIRFEPTSPVKP